MNPNNHSVQTTCNTRSGVAIERGVLFVLALLVAGPAAHAADSDLDPTFSGDGIAYADWAAPLRTDSPVRVAVAADVKVYVGGTVVRGGSNRDFAIARMRADGTFDSGFGFQGFRTVGFDLVADGFDTLNGVYPLADGKLMLLGRAEIPTDIVARARPAMVRLTSAGDADPTFGDAGKRVFTQSPWPSASLYVGNSTRQADGKFLFGGYCLNCPDTYRAVVLRVSANGEPDPTFGTNGWASIPVEGQPRFNAIATDPEGRIVLAGYRVAITPNRPVLVRFTPSGQADASFGAGTGEVQVSSLPATAPAGWEASALAIERDGSLLVAVREVTPPATSKTGIMRLAADGTFDAAYAGTGFRDLTRENGSRINGLALRSDRRLFAVGQIDHTGGGPDVYVARLLANGNLDNSFDGNGVLRIELEPGSSSDAAVDVILSGGKPLIGGYANRAGNVDGAVLRLQSDLIFADGLD